MSGARNGSRNLATHLCALRWSQLRLEDPCLAGEAGRGARACVEPALEVRASAEQCSTTKRERATLGIRMSEEFIEEGQGITGTARSVARDVVDMKKRKKEILNT
jgi:hypothetical protein